ncbi:hypothetical protein KIW84_071153 [Lathyrus oleraceus]|uniref:Uncharacterized protein n=1 Tax=Pisum sativum TaxID=3888 RepID=A0A9D4VIA1_PEA|nr:hypothetical protein KIW84_071153 [Pisum sativum]
MDVVREEQAAFREEMDSVKSKIEQIFEAIQALARREEEARVVAAARNDALVQGVALQSGPSVPIPNPVIYGLPPGFVPPPERTHVPPPAHTSGVADGVAAQGPPIVNQVAIPRTDEELQDEFEMQNYNGATPMVIPTAAQDSEAILMCPAQYPTMPYRPISPVPIPAPVPHYQVPVPQYQAPQPQFQAPPPQHQQNNQPRPVQQQRPNQQRPYQQYNNVNTTPIPMTYTQLLPYLIQNGTVVPRALPPMPKPHKPWYDENARCAFHANSEGHTTENYKRVIQFTRAKIDEDVAVIVPVFDQERLPKPLVVPYQRNVDLEPVKKIEPMVIHVPAPFSFDSTKAVPWNYEPVVYVDQKIHQGKVPSIQEIFSKAGFRSDDQVNALEDEDLDLSKMVFCGPPDAALTNWKATDVPDIVSCSK